MVTLAWGHLNSKNKERKNKSGVLVWENHSLTENLISSSAFWGPKDYKSFLYHCGSLIHTLKYCTEIIDV